MRLFTEFFAPSVKHHREMHIGGVWITQQLLQVNLPRSGVQQILPAYHMGNILFGVIHHNRQLVSKNAVSATQHEIANITLQPLLNYASQCVLKFNQIIICT